MVRRIEGITVELNGDTSGLTSALRQVDSATRTTSAELRQIENGLRFDPSSTELLAQRQQVLANQIGNTSDRLGVLRQAQSQVQAQFERGDIGADQYRAFQRELIRTEQILGNLQQRASNTNIDIDVDAESAERDIGRIEGALRELPSTASSVASSVATSLGGIATAASAAVGGLVVGFTDTNRDIAALNVQLGQVGLTLGDVTAATTAFSAVGQETDQISEAFGNLVQAGFQTEEAITGISQSIAGAIVAYGDTFSAEGLGESIALTTQLGEANGQFLDLLEREGVNLDTFNAQLGAIADTEERANFIAETFADQGLTALFDAYATGNPSIIAQAEANAQLQQNLSQLSVALTPLVTSLTEFANIILDAVNGNISFSEALDQIKQRAGELFPDLASSASKAFTAILDGISEVIPEFAKFISEAIPQVISSLQESLPEFIESGVSILESLIEGLETVLPQLLTYAIEVINLLVDSLIENLPQLIESGERLLIALIEGITEALPTLIEKALEIITVIAKGIIDNLPQLIETGLSIIEAILTGLADSIGKILDFIINEFIPKVVKEFIGYDWASLGKEVINGIVNGINQLSKNALDAITGVANGVINAAKKALGINSPSRVFTEFGEFIGIGLANGIEDTGDLSVRITQDIGQQLIDVQENTNKELTNLNNKLSEDIRDVNEKTERTINSIQQKANKERRRLTAQENQNIQRARRDNAEKIRDLENKASQGRIKIAQDESKNLEEVYDNLFNNAESYVERQRSLNKINITEEANFWRDTLQIFEEGSTQYIAAQEKYADVSNEIRDRLLSINQDYTNQFNGILEEQARQEEELTSRYTDALNDRTSSLENFTGLFDAFTTEIGASGQQLIGNLASQISGLRDYQDQINSLEARGLNEALIQQLRELGPDALPELRALNSLTDEELEVYQNLFEERGKLARQQAERELTGLKDDTEEGLKALRLITGLQLERLETEWIRQIDAITDGTEDRLLTLRQIGNEAGLGLRDGLRASEPQINEQARKIAESVQNTIKKALDIRSPSRVLRGVGLDAGAGLSLGLDDSLNRIRQSSNRLAQATSNVGESLSSSSIRSQRNAVSQNIINNNNSGLNGEILTALNQIVNKSTESNIYLDGRLVGQTITPYVSSVIGNNYNNALRTGGIKR